MLVAQTYSLRSILLVVVLVRYYGAEGVLDKNNTRAHISGIVSFPLHSCTTCLKRLGLISDNPKQP
jgi:hypothetical protein